MDGGGCLGLGIPVNLGRRWFSEKMGSECVG